MGARLPLTTHLADRVRQMLTDRAGWARFSDEVREWLEMQAYRSQMPKPGQLLVETFPHDKRHYMVTYPFEGWNAHQSLGMLNAGIKDWHLFLNVANIAVVGVNPSTPWQNVGQLIEAMKARPDIKVATAGVTSGGHNAMEAISRATGAKYRHVTYDGGNPAVVATVSGETEVTTQLAVEQAEMIRGKRLRPLATVSDRPLEIEGFGVIEPISRTIAGFKAPPNYFGIFIPKGVPAEVIATLEKAWAEHIVNNEALKKYAANRGALFAPAAGEAAQTAAFPAVQANAWLLHAGGKTKVAPDTVGIAKP
jgi:tripartite-type tricarboxylate transporter receptor subunit TctC